MRQEAIYYKERMAEFRRGPTYAKGYKRVIHWLRSHPGQAFKSPDLCAMFGLDKRGRELRKIINYARKVGHPICSGGRGYWATDDYEEMVDNARQNLADAYEQIFTFERQIRIARRPQQMRMYLMGSRRAA